MKIYITGIAGFIGSSIARRAIADGYDVYGIDSLTDYYDISLKKENALELQKLGAQITFNDINSPEVDMCVELEDVSTIFHEAGQPGVRASWGSTFSAYTDANVMATQRLLDTAAKMPTPPRIVYASSSSVYGNAKTYPTMETDLPIPLSPYGVTKLAAEHLCVLYALNYGLHTVSLRYFTIFGPRQRPDMAFNKFIRSALSGNAIPVFGSGEQIRDFTYIDDVVSANMLAANSETVPGAVYNVAGGTNVTVNEVLKILADTTGKELVIDYQDPVPGDVFQTGGSTEKIRRELGWLPSWTLKDGLESEVEWVRSRADG